MAYSTLLSALCLACALVVTASAANGQDPSVPRGLAAPPPGTTPDTTSEPTADEPLADRGRVPPLAAPQDEATDEATDAAALLVARLAAAERAAAAAWAEADAAADQVQALERANEQLGRELEALAKRSAEAEATAGSAAADLDARTATLEAARQELTAARAESASLRGRLTAAESQARETKAAIAAAIEALRQELAASEQAAAAAEQQAKALLSELEAARNETAAAQEAAEAAVQSRAAAANVAADEAADGAAALGRDLAAARDEIAALQSQLADLEGAARRPADGAGGLLGWVERSSDLVIPGLLLIAALLALGLARLRRRRADQAAQAAAQPIELFVPKTPLAATEEPPPARQTPTDPGTTAPAAPDGDVLQADADSRTWQRANHFYGELSELKALGSTEDLRTDDGPSLALACRAAGLDRLAFAALYLQHVTGATGNDPDCFAAALRLFESLDAAGAQARLAGQPPPERTGLH